MAAVDLTNYPNICWALGNNERVSVLIQNFEYPIAEMANLEKLIKELRELGCIGIQEKFSDLNEKKVYSTIAELEIAYQLLRKGLQVTLLRDNHFSGKSPDMIIKTKQGRSIYIEVGYISSSDPTSFLIGRLRDIVANSPYIVNFSFKPDVSSPHLSHEIRKPQMKKLEDAANKFDEELKNLKIQSFPIRGDTDAFSYEIIGTVTEGHGYPAVLVTACCTSLDHSHSHVTYYLNLKVGKRVYFPTSEQEVPYILAFVCDEPGISCYEVKSLLYGDVTEIAMMQDTPHYRSIREWRWIKTMKERQEHISWSVIEMAKKSGWEVVLSKTYLTPNEYCYVEKQGLYLTCPVMKSVSGVIFYSSSRRCEFYPNPFSSHKINCPSLSKELDLTFSDNP